MAADNKFTYDHLPKPKKQFHANTDKQLTKQNVTKKKTPPKKNANNTS